MTEMNKPSQSFVNMLVSIVGLAIVIGGLIYSQASTNAKFEAQAVAMLEAQKRQDAATASLEADRKASRADYQQQMRDLVSVIAKQSSTGDQMTLQIGMLQKQDEATDQRITRITDNNAERFDALQEAVSELKTGQALTNQTISEIKALLQQQTPNIR